MVVPVEKPTVTQQTQVNGHGPRAASNGAKPTNGATTKAPLACPRCAAPLWITYEEPECLQCGYVDYTYTPPVAPDARKSIISTATHFVLRYVGDFPALADTLAHVQVQRVRNFVVHAVQCPFCDQAMVQSSLSGNRKGIREGRYKCPQGHRLSLTPDRNGGQGWK